jgi:hypothetical protein
MVDVCSQWGGTLELLSEVYLNWMVGQPLVDMAW